MSGADKGRPDDRFSRGRVRRGVTGRRRTIVALALAGAAVSATALSVGCSDGPEIDGALVYAQRCAFCHDVEGQVGAEITAATLASRGDEETLTRYLRLAMPYEAPGTMTDEEYRATARYLLETRGLAGEGAAGSVAGRGNGTGENR